MPAWDRSEQWRPRDLTAWHLDMVWRAYGLRQAGRLPVLLIEQSALYVTEDLCDPWGAARRISWPQLAAMVEAAEALPLPKPIVSARQDTLPVVKKVS